MKFLCTKVKQQWLSSLQNSEKVINKGLSIKESFIGIEIKDSQPTKEEYNLVNNAVDNLFGGHRKAFPVRLIEL